LPGPHALASLASLLDVATFRNRTCVLEVELASVLLIEIGHQNFQRFGQVVDQVKDISDVTAATNEYSKSARSAATALTEMSGTFQGASTTMNAFNNAAEDTTKFHQQVQVLSKNLGSLNQIYEVELQDAHNHLKAMNKFYSNLVNASDAMASSAQDAVATKEQIALLSKNLTTLNQIYGNMLSAMQGR
ncbi:MAG: gliding motility protein GldL, partial [Chitinophagaceae bacterium]